MTYYSIIDHTYQVSNHGINSTSELEALVSAIKALHKKLGDKQLRAYMAKALEAGASNECIKDVASFFAFKAVTHDTPFVL